MQGHRHEVLSGGKGTDSGATKSPTTKLRFLLALQPFYFENVEIEKFGMCSENFLKNSDFWGTFPQDFWIAEDTFPNPGGDAHAGRS